MNATLEKEIRTVIADIIEAESRAGHAVRPEKIEFNACTDMQHRIARTAESENRELNKDEVACLDVNAYPQFIDAFYNSFYTGSRLSPDLIAEYIRDRYTYFSKSGRFFFVNKDGSNTPDTKGAKQMRLIINNLIRPEERAKRITDEVIDQLLQTDTGKDYTAADAYTAPKSFADLQRSDVQPPLFFVEGMIPEGLTFISAPPKTGKSWLALDLCVSVASGTPFLDRATKQCDTLYYDFESSEGAIKQRLDVVSKRKAIPGNAYFKTLSDIAPGDRLPLIGSGFESLLEAEIAHNENLKLIIIDTYRFIAAPQMRTETQYQAEYRSAKALQMIGSRNHVAVVCITHNTKMKHPEDIFSDISGTNGLTGAADANIVIAKEKRTDSNAVLAVEGRHARDFRLSVELDKDMLFWKNNGETDIEKHEEEKDLIRDYNQSEIKPAVIALAEELKEPLKLKAAALKDRINNMGKRGVYITAEPRSVGLALCKFQALFLNKDNVKIIRESDGTSGHTYTIYPVWKDAEEDPMQTE